MLLRRGRARIRGLRIGFPRMRCPCHALRGSRCRDHGRAYGSCRGPHGRMHPLGGLGAQPRARGHLPPGRGARLRPLPRLVASGPHRLPRPAREEAKARSSPHRAVGFPKPGGRFVLPLSPFLSGGKRNRKSIATLAGRIGRLCEPLMPKEEARRSDRTEPAVPRMPPGGCLRVDCSGEALAGPPGGASPSPS